MIRGLFQAPVRHPCLIVCIGGGTGKEVNPVPREMWTLDLAMILVTGKNIPLFSIGGSKMRSAGNRLLFDSVKHTKGYKKDTKPWLFCSTGSARPPNYPGRQGRLSGREFFDEGGGYLDQIFTEQRHPLPNPDIRDGFFRPENRRG